MKIRDYIDPDEGREDLTASVAVHVCENCGQTCDELIDLPTWNFKACATCAEDAAQEDAREAEAIRKAREASARTFAPKPCVNCKTRMAIMFNDFKFSDVLPIEESVAVNVCENCGATCETLIDLPTWNFKACATCAEEAAREDAREAAELRKLCVNCKTKPARWDSLYCSDRCKSAFLYFPEVA